MDPATDGDLLAKHALEALMEAGAEHAQCRLVDTDRVELNAEWDEPSLLRSTREHSLQLVAIKDGKKGTIVANDTTPDAVARLAAEVVAYADASAADEANAIAPPSDPATFESGPAKAALDGMHDRLTELLAHRKERYPTTTMRQVVFDFTRETTILVNSNGVDLRSNVGGYNFVAMFSSRDGADTSSFNYTSAHTRDLDRPVIALGSFERLMGQSGEQLHTERSPDKFVGDLVVTPDCLGSFLGPITQYLSDDPLITGTSVYKDRLGERIVDEALTLRLTPRDPAWSCPRFITRDGFVSRDTTVIERGVLKHFLLSQYGARKTGGERSPADPNAWAIDAGEVALDDLIGGVERGVLICRFSGGRPNDAGDFSGIAKNSYLIEDGKIGVPLSETMVSGNLVRAFEAIGGISKERVDFGNAVLPWIRLPGVTIS